MQTQWKEQPPSVAMVLKMEPVIVIAVVSAGSL